mmetsp:Transcript_33091/g.83178  ORF Transcript_33091/g.83178 Transcript_33091/m.83178 type:complete len:514 (+) Transcript_33091:171-1712(+)|eukprot:CAMPEP_0177677992 /NCGR_PEP_ID=MMETSP0447-20121125/28744_1 /TAXON_ID=0 /ORGANISM="Stygamoeba regulata, Strain BSH-02190019" /LENGTH=513 /DNA_ID=CAMNT_0019186911 /DNA_START=152 /DNA_END=1693 /DNA_ORIENTATION=-
MADATDVEMADSPMVLVDADEPEEHEYDYDLMVIGGGSGGLACAKQAGLLGKKVAVFDYVKPSPAGSTWGLGGTCVNVGCIPKKLMHTAALRGEGLEDANDFGWQVGERPKFDWKVLREHVQNHLGSLNFGHKKACREKGVQYIPQLASFVDPHTIEGVNRRGKAQRYTTRRVVIAVGGRPSYPDVPGARELCISSDDVFALEEPPGKTLVVGASYVALECAGFLVGVGFDVTVMVRSILLRGFDQQMANQIGEYMRRHGTKFIQPATPTRFEKTEDGRIRAYWKSNGEGAEDGSDVFDTVLLAIGRYADTPGLKLENAGVKTDRNGKIPCVHERTNVSHIYAIGDVVTGLPELTPSAIQAGKLLARRLYDESTVLMDYDKIPTTVFTPLEYSCCGLSEEEAERRFGKDDLEVYHTNFLPLEWTVVTRRKEADLNSCYLKLIVSYTLDERVVGLHYLGPNAAEVMQGFAIGIRMGATKSDFDALVGIHPSTAEEFTKLEIAKSSGLPPTSSGC